jgi:hypothetical protein
MTIFRAWITLRNGKRLYAKQVGIRAFPIEADSTESAEIENTPKIEGDSIEEKD